MLRDYLGKVERDYKRGIATEHSYRGTLQDLLETLNSNVTATNEPKRIKCGAPDYVIERNRGTNTFTIGYVEAKDAGMNLDEIERDARLSEPKTREGKQLKRYLPGTIKVRRRPLIFLEAVELWQIYVLATQAGTVGRQL